MFFRESESLNDTQSSWTVLSKAVKMESKKRRMSEMNQKSHICESQTYHNF